MKLAIAALTFAASTALALPRNGPYPNGPYSNGTHPNGPYPTGTHPSGPYPTGTHPNGPYRNVTRPNGLYSHSTYPNGTHPNGTYGGGNGHRQPHHLAVRAADAPIWAADFSNATDSTGAGFTAIQIQYGGGEIQNGGPAMPVVDHPKLGRALRIHLEPNQERWEAAPPPGAADRCGEGDDLYFRVDFVLDPDFPVDQPDAFSLVNQIHHGGTDGSPPVEFDISSGHLSVRGASTAYQQDLGPVAVDTVYKLVYRVKFSATPQNALLEVWLNDQPVLANFQPPCPTLSGGDSYWKGATMYCEPSIPPLTVYQNAHRVGTTLASVTA